MESNVTTLRPGYLVRLSTTLKGNVSYFKQTIDPAHLTDKGSESETWQTNRVTQDPDEQKRAEEARAEARAAIMRVCVNTQFGPLCPEQSKADLDSAIAEARKIAQDHNASAIYSVLKVYVLAGRVAPDDAEAIRSINAEMRDLLDTMQNGLANLDAKTVRDAANRARSVGMMLSPKAQATVQEAIDAARRQARAIVKAGELVAVEIDRTAIDRINTARTAFLDLDDAREIAAPSEQGRGVDLDKTLWEEEQRQASGEPPRRLELDMDESDPVDSTLAAAPAPLPLFDLT